MQFLIQHNLLSNDLLMAVKDAVQDLPHQFVGLIPFSREITSNEPIEGKDYIPYGSTSFVEKAMELQLNGLSFDVEEFSYLTAKNNRSNMLNGDNILTAGNMAVLLMSMKQDDDVFMRPAHDLKQFSGSVFKVSEAYSFLKDAMACASSGSYKIDPELLIVVSRPRNILAEWRWFIVGGKVIDGSLYRRNGQLHKQHIQDDGIMVHAQLLADVWLPNPCCVMDICLLDDGKFKIVEFNCINGSGFYDHDIKKIMTAWMEYYAPR